MPAEVKPGTHLLKSSMMVISLLSTFVHLQVMRAMIVVRATTSASQSTNVAGFESVASTTTSVRCIVPFAGIAPVSSTPAAYCLALLGTHRCGHSWRLRRRSRPPRLALGIHHRGLPDSRHRHRRPLRAPGLPSQHQVVERGGEGDGHVAHAMTCDGVGLRGRRSLCLRSSSCWSATP